MGDGQRTLSRFDDFKKRFRVVGKVEKAAVGIASDFCLHFRRVPSNSKPSDLEIHQLKYPTVGAEKDFNVIYPIERLQELVNEKIIGELAPNFYSFIGYSMDAERLEKNSGGRYCRGSRSRKTGCRAARPSVTDLPSEHRARAAQH